jgi:hypothetical protein
LAEERTGSLEFIAMIKAFVLFDSEPRHLKLNFPRDQTSILAWQPHSKDLALILGQSAYEEFKPELPVFNRFSMVSGKMETITSDEGSTAGPMTMADWDGDGDLDLFVGGRVRTAQFPQSPKSILYRNDAGTLVPDSEASRAFEGIGMVSAAIFSDLIGDNKPDLALACDWGALRIFENKRDGLLK